MAEYICQRCLKTVPPPSIAKRMSRGGQLGVAIPAWLPAAVLLSAADVIFGNGPARCPYCRGKAHSVYTKEGAASLKRRESLAQKAAAAAARRSRRTAALKRFTLRLLLLVWPPARWRYKAMFASAEAARLEALRQSAIARAQAQASVEEKERKASEARTSAITARFRRVFRQAPPPREE
jgi:hypothetical protein